MTPIHSFSTFSRCAALRAAIVLSSVLLPLAAASLPVAKPEDVGLAPERLQRIHEMIMRRVEAGVFAVHGSSSETQTPFIPCCANLYFDGAMGKRFCPDVIVVIRWPMRTVSGRSLSYHSFITGL